MSRHRAFTCCVLALAVILSLASAACASTAESPEPSEQPRSPAAQPSATVQVCPTPPATPAAALHPTSVASGTGQATLTGVQAEATACADRVTFTFSGGRNPAYDVRYEQSWTECGSGEPVTTAGPAQLIVQFRDTNAHDDAGSPTAPRSLKPALPSLKEAVQTCDFEADVAYALGTEERHFTVTALHSPERVVVEIAH
jgi:hypothetical protein